MKEYLDLIRNYPRYVGYGILHMFFSYPGQSLFIGMFSGNFVKEFGLTNAGYAEIYSVCTIISAVLLTVTGGVIDKIKLRHFSIVNGVGLGLICILLSFASNYVMLIVGIIGIRLCGQGIMPHISSTSVARYFEKERGKAMAMASLGMPIAEILIPGAIAYCIAAFDWKVTLQLIGFSVFVLFIPLSVMMVGKNDEFQTVQKKNSNNKKALSRKDVLKDRFVYFVAPLSVTCPFILTGFFIHQGQLSASFSWEPWWLASAIGAYGMTRLFIPFFAGYIIDRFSGKQLFILHVLPFILGLASVAILNNVYTIHFFLITTGVSVGMGAISKNAMWAEVYGVEHLGAIKSMMTTLVIFATAIGPIFLGALIDNNASVKEIFGIAVLFSIINTILAIISPKKEKYVTPMA